MIKNFKLKSKLGSSSLLALEKWGTDSYFNAIKERDFDILKKCGQ